MLDQGVPKTLGLKDIISKYVDYQKEVIIRRTKFDLNKDEKRAHILEGLKIALDHIDAIVKLIRAAKSDQEAINNMMSQFGLSEVQAQAIMEMKLRRLTGLERDKIEGELNDLLKEIEELKAILASDEKILEVVKNEMLEIKDKFADERRTSIDMTAIDYIEDESLIPVEDIMVSLTKKGYIKRIKSDIYKTQNRGGVGVKGMATTENDYVEKLVNLKTHDYVLFFSNLGRVYRIKGYEIPEFSRQSKGLPIVNLLSLEKDESVNSILNLDEKENEYKYIVFVTKKGLVKRTPIEEFDSIRKGGKIAISLKDDDELVNVLKTTGNDQIVICGNNGRMVRFDESEARPMGRSASGVKGIDLGDGIAIGAEVVHDDDLLVFVTNRGYGKQTNASEYRLTHRGSKGVTALKMTDKNGSIIAVKKVSNDENKDLMIMTDSGTIIRLPLSQVSVLKRATQGVRLINLKDEQTASSVSIVDHEEEINDNSDESEVNENASDNIKEEVTTE